MTPSADRMPWPLRAAFLATDSLFLAYWTVSALFQSGMIAVPHAWMYEGFDQPRVIAWNWSFLPLDLAFSLLGFAAVALGRRGDPTWRPLALLSLAFTMAAGGMAVGYWLILGEIEPSWLIPNLLLVLWPLAFLPGLICDIGRRGPARPAA